MNHGDTLTGIKTYCPICEEEAAVYVNFSDYENWKNGELIQVAMPYLTPEAREQLITGVCPPCWDEMWNEDDEDDEG